MLDIGKKLASDIPTHCLIWQTSEHSNFLYILYQISQLPVHSFHTLRYFCDSRLNTPRVFFFFSSVSACVTDCECWQHVLSLSVWDINIVSASDQLQISLRASVVLMLTELFCGRVQKTQPKVEEEEEEEVREQPDPLHQLILHFSHNALTECRWTHRGDTAHSSHILYRTHRAHCCSTVQVALLWSWIYLRMGFFVHTFIYI